MALGIRDGIFCTGRIWILLYLFCRQITDTYCVPLKGELLPPQLICQGKILACHPKPVKFPKGFHVTQTENHWFNKIVHLAYLKKTIITHIAKVQKQLNLK